MSQSGPRQTKKQKKALAFRTRQTTGKKKGKDFDDKDALDFPIDENQDLAGLEGLPLETEEVVTSGRTGGRKGKAQDNGGGQAHLVDSKKRKREVEDVVQEKPRKKSKVQPATLESDDEGDDGQKAVEAKEKQPQRFILFIGNLKYSTTKDAILSHFSSCDSPPIVRLPTPKATQPASKSKGYAFLEFTEKKPLQQALRLHHSELEGRKINVELTAGGGGKSEHRLKKLQERNKGLHEQRKRRIEKRKSVTTAETGEVDRIELKALERPQRYSTTSGFGQAPSNKKTWSIPIAEDQGASKKPKKRKRPARPKDQGTGVNAIPVY